MKLTISLAGFPDPETGKETGFIDPLTGKDTGVSVVEAFVRIMDNADSISQRATTKMNSEKCSDYATEAAITGKIIVDAADLKEIYETIEKSPMYNNRIRGPLGKLMREREGEQIKKSAEVKTSES